ncbi:MAG: hypothetical protein ACK5Q5_24300 [Planctomycetaceae bacterium]
MFSLTLPKHADLQAASRLVAKRSLLPVMTRTEWAMLAGFGVVAAVMSTLLDFRLRLPGHAILRAVFPMAAGLAAVPRRGGGTVMGLSAGLASTLLQTSGLTGHGLGVGAFTSLLAIGPCLDVALWGARNGWQIWLSFTLSGVAANGLAFVTRGIAKKSAAMPLSFDDWLHRAPLSYLTCGLVAGLLSGMVWFAFGQPEHKGESPDALVPPRDLP